ncbi:MAG: hypothetical protein K2K90_00215 [Lachnospiraceae bacterium]|nr:hypothetical protein [Lachnospiraceae bacterium]
MRWSISGKQKCTAQWQSESGNRCVGQSGSSVCGAAAGRRLETGVCGTAAACRRVRQMVCRAACVGRAAG